MLMGVGRLPRKQPSWQARAMDKGCSRGRSRKLTASTAQVAPKSICKINRRAVLSYFGAWGPLVACQPAFSKTLVLPELSAFASNSSAEQCWGQLSSLPPGVAYARQGPLLPLELPKLEHTCSSCFPACVGDKCLLSIEGGSLFGLSPPYPLAIFSGGFTVSCSAYRSTAARLASWGYTVVRYNTRDALPDVLDDVTCVKLLRELIDWAATHPLMRRLADTRRVYATGHSRGAKLATLTAAADPRVAALFLMDPVDVTPYAPLSDRFPSAAAALAAVAQSGRFLPVAVMGSGQAGDCAPHLNNYRSFFQAAPSVAWEVLLPAAGHFQYLDSTTALQRAVCGGAADGPDDASVRCISQAALVAWGEAMVKLPGTDVLTCFEARCRSLGQPAGETNRNRDSSTARNNSDNSSNERRAKGWRSPPADLPLMDLRSHHHQQQALGISSVIDDEQFSDGSSTLQLDLQQWQAVQDPRGDVQQVTDSTGAGSDKLAALQHLNTVRRQQPPQVTALPAPRSIAQQHQQQEPGTLPRVQTRQDVWSSAHAPSPMRLRQLQTDLNRLLVSVSYQNAATVEVRSQFKNFA